MTNRDEQAEQVHDTGTDRVPGEQVANAAAETLHGENARPEQYEQPDAVVLPGGSTFIADETDEDDAKS